MNTKNMSDKEIQTAKEWNVFCCLERLKAFCEIILMDMEQAGLEEKDDYKNLREYLATLTHF